MIEVAITSTGIHMNGHANRSVNGQDIVCAAISALTCNLRADTDSGKTIIEWEHLDERGQLLVDSWFLGLTAINQEYNCIEFI